MDIFKPEPFTVSPIFAQETLLQAGEEIQSFEPIELKEGIEVLAHKNGQQTRGIVTNITEHNVDIGGKETPISDILFIII